MKNKHKVMSTGKPVDKSSFSEFFMPQNQVNAKEALRRVTENANSEQKAIIMGFRGANATQCC